MDNLISLWASSGLAQMQSGQFVMMIVGLVLLYLAINKGFEPLLLVPIGFGTLLANIPGADFDVAPVYDAMGQMESPGGLLYYIYHVGIETGLFPLVIFMGVGAMTDFGPLLANPKTLLLGAAAQVGIFTTVLGAVGLSHFGILDFTYTRSGVDRDYWWCRWPHSDLCHQQAGARTYSALLRWQPILIWHWCRSFSRPLCER